MTVPNRDRDPTLKRDRDFLGQVLWYGHVLRYGNGHDHDLGYGHSHVLRYDHG